jgi:hypothetical protein
MKILLHVLPIMVGATISGAVRPPKSDSEPGSWHHNDSTFDAHQREGIFILYGVG